MPASFQTEALSGLCSNERLRLIEYTNTLHCKSISSHNVSFPQIIVCGDQSVGKSSVLQALTGVPFPVESNACTRFPIKLVLCRASYTGVDISIVPDRSRSEAERCSLASFSETLSDFGQFPKLIKAAKAALEAFVINANAPLRDVLLVKISSPNQPELTILDLPGLVFPSTGQLSDLEAQDIVKGYMNQQISIILAVFSAEYHPTKQSVLRLARHADQDGARTLGIITKPDCLTPYSELEASYVTIVKNQKAGLRLGWHVLRNKDIAKEESPLLADRDVEEAAFFAQSVWRGLPSSVLGAENLRIRLREILVGRAAVENAALVTKIETTFQTFPATKKKYVEQLRTTLEKKKALLIQISQRFQSIVKESTNGTYIDPFFEDAQSDAGYKKRIRAIVQNLSFDYAETMAKKGHYFQVVGTELDKANVPKGVVTFSREQYLDRIQELTRRTRGIELPSMLNPMIVADLFREQSYPWEGITEDYIHTVLDATREFFSLAANHVTNTQTSKLLHQEVFCPALDSLMRGLKDKTTELLSLHRSSHPITYDQDLVKALQDVRQSRDEQQNLSVIMDFFRFQSIDIYQAIGGQKFRLLAQALAQHRSATMDALACSEALDCMEAYYKIALKRFVDNVATQVVEVKLISRLDEIFSPLSVSVMAPELIEKLAGAIETLSEPGQRHKQEKVTLQDFKTCTESSETQEQPYHSNCTKSSPVQSNFPNSDFDPDRFKTAMSDSESTVANSVEATTPYSEFRLADGAKTLERHAQKDEFAGQDDSPESPSEGNNVDERFSNRNGISQGMPQNCSVSRWVLNEDRIIEAHLVEKCVPEGLQKEDSKTTTMACSEPRLAYNAEVPEGSPEEDYALDVLSEGEKASQRVLHKDGIPQEVSDQNTEKHDASRSLFGQGNDPVFKEDEDPKEKEKSRLESKRPKKKTGKEAKTTKNEKEIFYLVEEQIDDAKVNDMADVQCDGKDNGKLDVKESGKKAASNNEGSKGKNKENDDEKNYENYKENCDESDKKDYDKYDAEDGEKDRMNDKNNVKTDDKTEDQKEDAEEDEEDGEDGEDGNKQEDKDDGQEKGKNGEKADKQFEMKIGTKDDEAQKPDEEKVGEEQVLQEGRSSKEKKPPKDKKVADEVPKKDRDPGFWGEWVTTKKERAARKESKAQQKLEKQSKQATSR